MDWWCKLAEEVGTAILDEAESRPLRRWNFPKSLWAVRAFSYPDYLLYWFGMLISFSGSWAQALAMAWLVLDLTRKPPFAAHQGFFLGLVTACGTVPFLVLALPAGVIADRFSKRNIALVTQSLAMIQAAILGVLAYLHIIQVWHVLVLAVFAGIVSAIDIPARHSMTAELVGKDELVNAVAMGSLSFNGARIIGPAIGGVLLYKYGASMCFIINAISFIAAILALALMKPTPVVQRTKQAHMRSEVKEGFKYVLSNSLVRDLMLMTVIICIFGTQYATVMPIWVKKVLHQNASVLGLIMSLTGIGAALGAVSVATMGHRFKQGMVVLMGTFILAISVIVVAITPRVLIPINLPAIQMHLGQRLIGFGPIKDVNLSVLMMVVVGYGMMLFLSVSNSLIQISAPAALRGRVMSIRTLMFLGIAPPLGGLLIGFLTDHAGAGFSLLFSGVVCLLTCLVFAVTSEAVRSAG